jgi:hypothetical protein
VSIQWKIRKWEHEIGGKEEWAMFVAPDADRTFQNAGSLLLSTEEAADLTAKLADKPAEFSNDLTAEEYNRLMEFLMEWSEQDLEALKLADMVKNKFGASARKRR